MPDKAVSLLLTGFGPFPGAPSNPSRALVERLARTRRPAFSDVRIASHVFATRYAAIDRDFASLIAAHDPDIILMFGLAARTRHIRIETWARNLMSFFPHAGGFVPATRTIAGGRDHRRLPPSLPRDCGCRPVTRPAADFRAMPGVTSAIMRSGARWR